MPTQYADIMEALNRPAATIDGDSSRDQKGIVERVNNHEAFIMEQREMFRKILLAAVIGALATLGNFFLNTRSLSMQQQQPPAIHATQPK